MLVTQHAYLVYIDIAPLIHHNTEISYDSNWNVITTKF